MFGGMAQALCQASKSSDHTTRFIVYVSVVIGVSLLVYTSGLTNKGNTVLDREQGCSCHFRKAPTRTISRLLGHLADPPSARRGCSNTATSATEGRSSILPVAPSCPEMAAPVRSIPVNTKGEPVAGKAGRGQRCARRR